MPSDRWPEALRLHDSAASAFAAAAEAVEPDAWDLGVLAPADGVLFCARHIEHHLSQLAGRRAG
ncbi:MAG TPA: hypothetical protein VNW71_11735 [Thermoanaerobaculia bacterium]|nr:hypothetical protein [Thermoanaerobaculia bacterium]